IRGFFAGHLEFNVFATDDAGICVDLDCHFLVLRLAQDGKQASSRQDAFAWLGYVHAAHLEADSEFEVSCHEDTAIGTCYGLEILEDRLDVARWHGDVRYLECRKQTITIARCFHPGVLPGLRCLRVAFRVEGYD